MIDCHVHIFDPARFPYAPDTWYTPAGGETGTAAQLAQVMDAHGVRHALLVGPNSGYGLDNCCLLDAIRHSGGRFKGVAVVRNDASRAELQDLQAQGVVGVAMNAALLGVDFYQDTGTLLARLRDLGLWAQVQVQGDQLVDLKPMLVDSGARLLFDHCGRPDPAAGVGQAGFAALLALADTGRCAVKLSSLVKCSSQSYPYKDAWAYVQALLQAYTPQHLVWGSDWPFLRAPARIDYGPLLALFEQLVPDAASRQAILSDTPKRLFGFGADIRPARFPEDLEAVTAIFQEYIASASVSLEFQNYCAEFSSLPGKYAHPEGRLLLAWREAKVVGCAALRQVDAHTCELKRVYVRPEGRGVGLGRQLVLCMLDEAKKAGYTRMCLDVLPEFKAATHIYESIGFLPAAPVAFNPVPGAQFLGLDLLGAAHGARCDDTH